MRIRPIFPFPSQHLHWEFPDPSRAEGTEEERLQMFCRVREELFLKICSWLAEQKEQDRVSS
jgi:arsenate reductase